jgi:hypothetical protein
MNPAGIPAVTAAAPEAIALKKRLAMLVPPPNETCDGATVPTVVGELSTGTITVKPPRIG